MTLMFQRHAWLHRTRFLCSASTFTIFLMVLSFVLLSNSAKAQVFDWTNSTGSPDPWYGVSGNWSPSGPPGSSDTARFNSAGSYEVWWDDSIGTPAVGFLEINSGDVTFMNTPSGTAQHGLTINGSGGAGSFSDYSISGISTSATIEGLHFSILGGGQILGGATLKLDGSHSQGSQLSVVGSTGFDISGNVYVQAGGIFESTLCYIGLNSGNGTLNVEAGGVVNNNRSFIGRNSNSTGMATVTGSGSQFNHSGSVEVGVGGDGTLQVQDGGLVTSTFGAIAASPSSTGVAIVTGSGSQWNNSNTLLEVGFSGHGTLNIEAGGVVSNSIGRLGANPGSTGVATVTGSGSHWNNSSKMDVGLRGNGTLNIQDGGLVSNVTGVIGDIAGSTGVAMVAGIGSQWNNSNTMLVGISGNATLNVQAGGVVTNTNGLIGILSGSTGVSNVSGNGSQWNNSGGVYVGGSDSTAGGTGTLTVDDGGFVSVAGTTKLWSQGAVTLDTGGVLDTQTLDLTEGSFEMLNGAVLHAGYVQGDLFNESGILSPGNSPGLTDISGNYEQGSAATLEIELGGLTTGQFDQLLIGGDVSWDGTLDVSLVGGFFLGANQQFQIAVVGGTQTGMFSGLSEGGLVGNYGAFDLFITYEAGDGNDVALFTAIPEPGTFTHLLFPFTAMLTFLRRRRQIAM